MMFWKEENRSVKSEYVECATISSRIAGLSESVERLSEMGGMGLSMGDEYCGAVHKLVGSYFDLKNRIKRLGERTREEERNILRTNNYSVLIENLEKRLEHIWKEDGLGFAFSAVEFAFDQERTPGAVRYRGEVA